ncbi:hypothetical protein HXS80_06365 [Streptomyces sp. CB04723]|uniref:hypothetical protein n=1 Tax=Streptomyces TaxID=1883 RepID=UPI0015C45132|nr:hypothetical protein [Streptomyces sp. CB04723]QLG31351.1 hypothetical protein HXS80_06365 [Streptomyces sp. CB04723]
MLFPSCPPSSRSSYRCSASAASLGYTAFVERNHPRYVRYTAMRLPADTDCAALVSAALSAARHRWDVILRQPSPAAEVWADLRRRVTDRAGRGAPPASEVRALYELFDDGLADSVVLCWRLGLGVDEAAELMGAEPPAVTASLAVAQRFLPDLTPRR